MLRPRIIVSLLLQNGGLVKTVNFSNPKYIGDPINAVKIFNEKEVDELVVFDIDATVLSKDPNYELIGKIAKQSRMPICYGGGIKSFEQAERIYKLGVEKLAFGSAAVSNPKLIQSLVLNFGSQSVIVVVDVKGSSDNSYQIWTHNGSKRVEKNLVEFVLSMQEIGIGELIINNIDRDGTFKGYDLELIDKIFPELTIPLTVLGGASSLDNLKDTCQRFKHIGLAVGSLFVYMGKYKAVLMNYPSINQKNKIIYNRHGN